MLHNSQVFRLSWFTVGMTHGLSPRRLMFTHMARSLVFAAANGGAAADWMVDLHCDWLHFWVWIIFFCSWAFCSNCCQANYKSNYEHKCRLIWIDSKADFRGSTDCWVIEVTALKFIWKKPQRHTSLFSGSLPHMLQKNNADFYPHIPRIISVYTLESSESAR